LRWERPACASNVLKYRGDLLLMSKTSPRALADQFTLRLPDGMRDAIAVAAKANERSMNAEILAHLQISLNHSNNSELPLERSFQDGSNRQEAAFRAELERLRMGLESLDARLKAVETVRPSQSWGCYAARRCGPRLDWARSMWSRSNVPFITDVRTLSMKCNRSPSLG
jgi:hypothetical protein